MRLTSAIALTLLGLTAVPTRAAQDSPWMPLFDGKSIANGWQPSEHPESWAVENSAIVTRGDRSHLFYVGSVGNHEFKNFELSAEVMTAPGSNGGIYIHTKVQGAGFPEAGYEMQVINSNAPAPEGAYVEHKMTGSIYAIRNAWKSPVKDNEWFTYRIRVVGKTIQTYINNNLICEYTEPENPFRPADKKGRLLGSGTVALQAHNVGSVVRYRNIRIRLLPDTATSNVTPIADRELDELITQFSNDNVPLIDIGLVPGTGPAAAALAAEARRYGVTMGSILPIESLSTYGHSVMVVNDRDRAPDPAVLEAAKAAGEKIVFSSGGDGRIDEARFKRRLQAMKAARLVPGDLWIPGNND